LKSLACSSANLLPCSGAPSPFPPYRPPPPKRIGSSTTFFCSLKTDATLISLPLFRQLFFCPQTTLDCQLFFSILPRHFDQIVLFAPLSKDSAFAFYSITLHISSYLIFGFCLIATRSPDVQQLNSIIMNTNRPMTHRCGS
jgi:hypothetical protein